MEPAPRQADFAAGRINGPLPGGFGRARTTVYHAKALG
jgi:hypothetical protein